MGKNTAKAPWYTGWLKESFLGYPKDTVVFFREAILSREFRSVGKTWLLKAQGHNVFHSVAESYGGTNLSQLVKWKRDSHGATIRSDPEQSLHLNGLHRKFCLSLPAGSRRYSEREQLERAAEKRNTVNIQCELG